MLNPSDDHAERLRSRLENPAIITGMEVGTLKFPWKIKDLSKLQIQKLYSDVFSLGPYKWRILACPKGEDGNADHLSVHLEVAESEILSFGWSQYAKFSITLINQFDKNLSVIRDSVSKLKFDEKKHKWGFSPFIFHKELHDPKKGYLVQGTCIIEADVAIYGDPSVESRGARKETSKEDNPLENSIKEDMDAFFKDLQNVISVKKVVSSDEEAKEALAVLEEAVNMAPADLNNVGRMSQLTNAFDVLSSLDDCSILTSEQKAELLSMKQNFISLPERATKAVEDIKLFNQQELVKATLDRKLRRCLIEFEKAKAETVQNEQNIAILHERVDSLMAQICGTKKTRENSLLKQKEMFKLSKELKAKLDVLVKNFPESEAKKESG